MCEGKSCFAYFYRCPERYLYVVGGEISITKISGSCEKFDIFNKKWTKLDSLNEVRCNPGITVFKEHWLYAFGGFKGAYPYYKASNRIDRLDVTN